MYFAPKDRVTNVEAETSERFFNPLVTLVGQCFFFAILAIIYFCFVGVAPSDKLSLWAGFALFVMLLTFVFVGAFLVRKPDMDEIMRVWRKLDRMLPQLFDLVLIAAIFLLFPFADGPREVLFTAFCVGYVPSQILSDPENTTGNQMSSVGILGAFALQLWLLPQWHTDVLAVMIIAYGVVMFIAAGSFRDIVRQAILARQQLEVVALERETALLSVSAERDARTKFLAAASHDLGQPLHATTLFLDSAQEAKTKDERAQSLEKAVQAVTAARCMVADMLSHARLEADAVTPSLRGVVLNEPLQSICAMLTPLAQQAGVSIRCVRSSRTILTDVALLKRALTNLVSNAISHARGTKILVGVRKVTKDFVCIYVIDNGVGIAADETQLVFQDFYQSKASEEQLIGGFGLGLASVRRIAVLLSGNIELMMLPSGGAVFLLKLPIY